MKGGGQQEGSWTSSKCWMPQSEKLEQLLGQFSPEEGGQLTRSYILYYRKCVLWVVSFQLPLGIRGLLLLYPLNVCTDTILSAVHIEHTATSAIKVVCASLSLSLLSFLPFCAPSHSERLVFSRQTDRQKGITPCAWRRGQCSERKFFHAKCCIVEHPKQLDS